MLRRSFRCLLPAVGFVRTSQLRYAVQLGLYRRSEKETPKNQILQQFRCFSIKRDATYLLVDADNVSVELIEEAKEVLTGHTLQVVVFAHPELCKAKKWKNFFQSPGHRFHPVERVGGFIDPNDEEIKREAVQLSKLSKTRRIALLTMDTDFVALVRDLKSLGKEVAVLTSKWKTGNTRAFEEAGATVYLLGQECDANKVRAILESDGSGRVEFGEDLPNSRLLELVPEVSDRLLELKYMDHERSGLVPAMAKFWFQNSLGPLVVCPMLSAVERVHQILMEERKAWIPYRHDLAFVLPVSGGASSTSICKSDKQKYGNAMSKQIFLGGGPFIVPKSRSLTDDFLRRLRYLDNDMNADPKEAMLIFLNYTRNKRNLRKTGTMPNEGDTYDEIYAKIKTALLSGDISGNWSLAPSDLSIRQKLVAEGLLDHAAQPHWETLIAMRQFARMKGLPVMKTYNGCVWQLCHWLKPTDPKRRDVLNPPALLNEVIAGKKQKKAQRRKKWKNILFFCINLLEHVQDMLCMAGLHRLKIWNRQRFLMRVSEFMQSSLPKVSMHVGTYAIDIKHRRIKPRLGSTKVMLWTLESVPFFGAIDFSSQICPTKICGEIRNFSLQNMFSERRCISFFRGPKSRVDLRCWSNWKPCCKSMRCNWGETHWRRKQPRKTDMEPEHEPEMEEVPKGELSFSGSILVFGW